MKLSVPTDFFRLIYDVENIFIEEIRDYFRTDSKCLQNNIVWVGENDSRNTVSIYNFYYDEERFFPQIVINASSGAFQGASFGEQLGIFRDEETGEYYERFGGFWIVNLNMKVLGLSVVDSGKVSDLLLRAIIRKKYDVLQQKGLYPYQPNSFLKYTGSSQRPFGVDRFIFENSFVASFLVEWVSDELIETKIVQKTDFYSQLDLKVEGGGE